MILTISAAWDNYYAAAGSLLCIPFVPKEELSLASDRGSQAILIAEDDTTSRQLTRTVLQEAGFTVIESVDGEDAIAKFTDHADSISLVVLDVIMPKKNGKEVYDAITAIRPDIKVLFMSGYTASIIYKKGVLQEGLNFLAKPVSPRVVLKRIRELLGS
jgi:DNA-binding response OmpR family regulator